MSELTDKLLTFPGCIKREELKVLNLTEVYELAHADVKEQDAAFAAIVNANPALKNQGQRDVEIKALREADLEYSDALIEEDTAAKNLAVARIDLNFVQNMFKAHLAIVHGGTPK